MIKILNDLPSFCEYCPYTHLVFKEKLGSGINAYTCKFLHICERVYDGALNQQTCEDCISREAVGNMLNRMQMKKDDTWYDYYQKALKELSELPPVYPKQKEGHWIRQTNDYHDYYECEYCGIAVGLDDIKNYCPNCGAKMVEPQESETEQGLSYADQDTLMSAT